MSVPVSKRQMPVDGVVVVGVVVVGIVVVVDGVVVSGNMTHYVIRD